jgi:hypothetical protein
MTAEHAAFRVRHTHVQCDPVLAIVPESVKISRSPWKVLGSAAPANRKRACRKLPMPETTNAALHDRIATALSSALRRSTSGETRNGKASTMRCFAYAVTSSLTEPERDNRAGKLGRRSTLGIPLIEAVRCFIYATASIQTVRCKKPTPQR